MRGREPLLFWNGEDAEDDEGLGGGGGGAPSPWRRFLKLGRLGFSHSRVD